MESTTEPTTLRAGDSVAWAIDLPDYPSSAGWVLRYRVLWRAGVAADILATGNGTRHSVSLSSADTESYTQGTATLFAYVERTIGQLIERVSLKHGTLTVLPNLVTAANHDGRSENQIALAHARAALADYMAKGQMHVAEYDIGGRVMKFRDVDQITNLIQHYEREVFKETAAAAVLNGQSAGRVVVRM